MDDGAPAQIEEILPCASGAGASSLPPTNMGKHMFNCYPFTQLGPPLWSLLTFSQLNEQGFIEMNTHAAPFRAGCTLGFQRTLSADICGKVNDPAGHKRHFLFRWTTNHLPIPIEGERLLGKTFSLANWPSFAINLQLIVAFTHQMTTQIGAINMEFL